MNALRTGAEMVATELHKVHQKRTGTNQSMAPYTHDYCVECQQPWPCATEQALQTVLDCLAPHDNHGDGAQT